MGDDDTLADDELYKISTSVDVLQDFLSENKDVLTLIGVFSAVTIYFQQDNFVNLSNLASDVTLFSGVGIVSLLFIVVSYNIVEKIFDNGGPGIPANILLVVFFILLLSFIIPTLQYVGNISRGINTIGQVILLAVGFITFVSIIFKLNDKEIYSKISEKYLISEGSAGILIFLIFTLQYYVIDGILIGSTNADVAIELGNSVSSVWAYIFYHISLTWSIVATGILSLYVLSKIKDYIDFVKHAIITIWQWCRTNFIA